MPLSPPVRSVNLRLGWKIAVWCLAALSASTALYLFVKSQLSFDDLRSLALSSIPPGYDDRFTIDLYIKITSGLRLLAGLLGLLSISLAVSAAPLSRHLIQASEQLRILGSEVLRRTAGLRFDPLHLVTLLIIFFAACTFRVAFINEPIRNDESYSFMYYASRPLFVALTYYTVNNHMLNTLLMHVSTSVFGASVWALRLPTLIAGVLLVPSTYAATRLYQTKNAALIAAALVSGSSPLIEYSFNARGYSLGALFFMLMITSVGLIELQLLGAWYFLPVLASLALYSVPTMVYGVGGICLYLLLRRFPLRKSLLLFISTALLTLMFYSPVIFTVGPSAVTSNRWVVPVPRAEWQPQFGREMVSLWIYWNLDLPAVITVLVGLGIIVALCSSKTYQLPPAAPLLCVVLVAGVLLPLQRLVPFRRTWLFLLPLCFATAALGLSLLFRKLKHSDLVSAVLSLLLAGIMGGTVLKAKSLRNSGIESVGGRGAEAIVLATKGYLQQGAQFICADSFDSPIDFELYLHEIPYHPSPDGDLLIVTPVGKPPERTLEIAGISPGNLLSIRKLGQFANEDVYLGVRGPNLPFQPFGSTWMGEFKSIRQ